MNPLHAAALELIGHGCSVVPIRPDGSKSPAVPWKRYTDTPPDEAQVEAWFAAGDYDGLGVVTGAVSGNLELLEVEGRAISLVPHLANLLADHGLDDLWKRLCRGWMIQSPSGGIHWYYRVDGDPRPNTKLARQPNPDNPHLVDVLIETRGQGGQAVVAPSGGRTHPTGKPWCLVAGGPATIPVITGEERDALHAIATLLDTMPTPTDPGAPPAADPFSDTGGVPAGTRPGDDYNARTSWDDILIPHGWTKGRRLGAGYAWTRPGKSARDGISATTGTAADGVDRLYVFTTSTEFEPEHPYSKFAAHTLLEHGGDYAAAAKALQRAGYGTPPPEPPRPILAAPNLADVATTPLVQVVEPVTYSASDDGNALRLVDTHHDLIRFNASTGDWLHWDGHRWTPDDAGAVHELARSIARDLPTNDNAARTHRLKSLSNRGLKAMVTIARTDRRVVVLANQLDRRAYELNTPGGIINLRTGRLTPSDPKALHTRTTTVTPDLDADAPQWARFLADTFAGDPDLATYIQRLLGMSLIGRHLEQILPFGWGAGANGKSTLLNVVQALVGTGRDGYSIAAPAELLLKTHQRQHPTELARLSGARIVVSSELEEGEQFAEARLKMLTGGDPVTGRFMGQDFFTFDPTHTIWLLANNKPAVRAGGPAFWRRLRLIEFAHIVPPEQRVAELDAKLVEAEGPAILGWIIRGAADYCTRGLAEPASVKAATGAYERDQDTVARFVDERCQRGPAGQQGMSVRVAEVRAAYETWCRQEGEQPVTAKALTTALTTRFDVLSERTMAARFYAGIRLLEPATEDTSAAPVPEGPDDRLDGWWNR